MVAYGSFGGFDVCDDLSEIIIGGSRFQVRVTVDG